MPANTEKIVPKKITEQSVAPNERETIKATRKAFNEQPREPVIIPVNPMDPLEKTATVIVNGYWITVQRGKTVYLPEEVVGLLRRKHLLG